jgi:hypothetical protein
LATVSTVFSTVSVTGVAAEVEPPEDPPDEEPPEAPPAEEPEEPPPALF